MRILIMTSVAALAATSATFAGEPDQVLYGKQLGYDQAEKDAYHAYRNEAISGFVEGSYAHSRLKGGDFEIDANTWALRGAVNAAMDSNLNVQFDGGYSRTDVEGIDADTFVGAAHIYYREPERFAVGGFAQAARIGSSSLDFLAPFGLDNYATDYLAGGEAAVFTDLATFYGQLGFGRASYSGFNADHLMAKAGVRLYATDNLRLDGEAAFNRLSIPGGNAEIQSYSATGNYRFDEFPVTAFAGYRYDTAKLNAGNVELGSGKAHNFLTGLRFHFGSGSLKDEERHGPVWNTTTPLL